MNYMVVKFGQPDYRGLSDDSLIAAILEVVREQLQGMVAAPIPPAEERATSIVGLLQHLGLLEELTRRQLSLSTNDAMVEATAKSHSIDTQAARVKVVETTWAYIMRSLLIAALSRE